MQNNKDILKKALLEIRSLKERVRVAASHSEPAAIVGMACRLPGGITDTESCWKALWEGRDLISEVPEDRWNEYDKAAYLEDERLRKGGFLTESIEDFDSRLFRMMPVEAASIDPQQRLALEVCWELLENAGIAPDSLKGKKVGVFVGVVQNDFGHENYMHENNDDVNLTGIDFSFLSGRISYFFGFSGPSVSIDTACSSSAVAIDTAIKYLRDHDCDMALVCGVNIMFSPETTKKIAGLGILSADGEVRAFDKNATGTVRGEGIAAILLKRLSDAERDGDSISSLIIGSAVNRDGASSGLTAPNGAAQTELLKTAWEKSGIGPEELTYIETHGTGTALGDPIEIKAITDALGSQRKTPVYIGSVKTNLGHLEGAAGIVSVIKTSLMLEKGMMPESLHFDTPSEYVDWDRIPVKVASSSRRWKRNGSPNVAGVSSFGLSGTNVHIVMKEYERKPSPAAAEMKSYPFLFTAPTRDGLKRNMKALLDYLNSHECSDLTSLSCSYNTTRAALSHRACISVSDRRELEQTLTEAVSKGFTGSMMTSDVETAPKTVFLFTGQGSQYNNMCRSFYDNIPAFREAFDECAGYYFRITCKSLNDVVFSDSYDLKKTVYTQPALFACEYALAKMWQSFGVSPDIVIGHSIGEYAAACIAGVMSAADAMKLVTARGRILHKLAPKGKMAALSADRERASKLIERHEGVYISLSNSQAQAVVAGTEEAMDSLLAELESKDVRYKLLLTTRPFHTPLMKAAAEEFRKAAQEVRYSLPTIRIISNVTGRAERERLASADYWVEHILSEVRFCDSINGLGDLSDKVFLEVGVRPVLTGIVGRISDGNAVCIPSADRERTADEMIPSALSSLFLSGAAADLRAAYTGTGAVHCPIPNYAFEKKRIPFIHTIAGRASIGAAVADESGEAAAENGDKAEALRAVIADFAGVAPDEINERTNLIRLGIDSVSAVRLISRIRSALGVKLSLAALFEHPTFGDAERLVREMSGEAEKTQSATVSVDQEHRFEPFPLNDVQYAYWAGRDNVNMLLSQKACCAYFEADLENVDPDRFIEALRKLEERHDMLRCRITEDAVQYTEAEAAPQVIVYSDIPREKLPAHLNSIRNEMSDMILPLGGPLYQVRMTRLLGSSYRIHFYIDFMIADAASLYIFIRDLESLYNGADLAPLSITYRDYFMHTSSSEELAEAKRADESFWEAKAESFPKAPELPYEPSAFISGVKRRFVRREKRLSQQLWKKFSDNAAEYGLTPSGALFGLYSEVLSAFGGGSSFAVMLTVFRRHDISPDVGSIIGDFTRLAPVEVYRKNVSIAENAREIQGRMLENISHSEYSAVEFTDKLRKLHHDDRMYNVIFTSAVGVEHGEKPEKGGLGLARNLRSIVSSTPQVCLDHQVFYENGDIVISWDTADEVFAEGVVDAMFGVYSGLIDRAVGERRFFGETLYDLRPEKQKLIQASANETSHAFEETVMTAGFEKNAAAHPERTALITDGRAYTYGELDIWSDRTASALIDGGAKKGDRVLVDLPKSFEQIYSVLGILKAGCIYVPLTHGQPAARTLSIISRAQPFAIIANEDKPELKLRTITPSDISRSSGQYTAPVIKPSDGAYIIYTSGSTGVPKGVFIAHGSAMNTILDVNRRYSVGGQDRAIGVSALSFDLSVYDIFGMLTAGGALVLPTEEQRIDPAEQYKLVTEYGVTIWNSVPALMDIYTDLLVRKGLSSDSIRRVILSGDWIPMTLPEKLAEVMPECALTSMGGATEASIWSNYYDVVTMDESWRSVPYGYPLANQRFYILDEFGRRCPDRVSGRLHIAGSGLAECYYNEEELTDKAFYFSEAARERVYDTGDYGRYIGGGVIEFLGRKDGQVKINGYRIETAEIASAFRKCGVGDRTYVLPVGGRMKKIAVFIETVADVDSRALKKKLGEHLPDYFIPEHIFTIEQLPVTGNGKIDAKKLTELWEQLSARQSASVTEQEKDVDPVLAVIRKILGISSITASDSFGQYGVSSVEMIHLADELESVYGIRPSISKMLNSRTVSEIIDFFAGAEAAAAAPETASQGKQRVKRISAETEERQDPTAYYRELGIELYAEDGKLKFRAAKGVVTKEVLERLKAEKQELMAWLDEEKKRAEKLERYYSENKYPLTPIQKAYLMGRSGDYELGGTSAHYYTELKWQGLDAEKLEEAVNRMIDIHDILRTVILPDGNQADLDEVPVYRVADRKVNDKEFMELRERMKAHVYEAGKWPMFDVFVSRREDGTTVVHFSFDCMLLDGWSANMMIREIFSLCSGRDIDEPDYTFRQYVEEKDKWLESKDYYTAAQEYWAVQGPKLPPAPHMPYRVELREMKTPHFARKRAALSRELTMKLNERIKSYSTTASAVICTAYMRTISAFGGSDDFSLDLTLYNRLPINKEVPKLLGDFTNVTLIPYHRRGSFIAEAEEVRRALVGAVEHRTFNGLELLKNFAGDDPFKAVMPVVFTSELFGNLDEEDDSEVFTMTEEVFSISQTPQVALDHQALVRNGELVLIWDHVEELFEKDIIDKMFSSYVSFVERLAEADSWDGELWE
ncbi:non-ribosomal peptide synthetase/type I polyketide synthase [Ruminococcus sp.]|uniref:non-ribosomal peptide synthetase/type I polyketide synthase n=1 Tax=Ruminococcus sp. TaxID=41978 RepID=UPI002B62C1AF|nr:non-ribosomal peptide synthetase/type I polyketide synthase [Ruminococcus sp.]HNZ98842.1 amino acid adenylation domain-containing protein [Ruminococcus sp.]